MVTDDDDDDDDDDEATAGRPPPQFSNTQLRGSSLPCTSNIVFWTSPCLVPVAWHLSHGTPCRLAPGTCRLAHHSLTSQHRLHLIVINISSTSTSHLLFFYLKLLLKYPHIHKRKSGNMNNGEANTGASKCRGKQTQERATIRGEHKDSYEHGSAATRKVEAHPATRPVCVTIVLHTYVSHPAMR
jgi:hypothetical protein